MARSQQQADNLKLTNFTSLLTLKECQFIVQRILKEEDEEGLLKTYQIVPVLDTVGYLGEYFHLKIKYQKDNHPEMSEKRLFIKCKPYQNPQMSEFIEKSGMLKKESTLYMGLLNDLKKFSPKVWFAQCYFTRPDLFVMENINDLGYEPLKDNSKFLNIQELKSVLMSLATMHASSIAYEQMNDIKIGEQFQDVLYECTVSHKVVWYTAGVKAILEVARQLPQHQSEALQLFLKNDLPGLIDSVYEMVNPSTEYYNVFSHRDVWGGNIFFDKTNPYEKGTVFVDFQLCRYSPPAIDVLMALFLNTKPTDRKKIQNECIEFYYECFTNDMLDMELNAEEFLTTEDLYRSLREFALFGAVYNCIAATILRVPDDYLKNMKLNHPEDFYKYTNVDRTQAVLDLMKNDKEFESYISECIYDLMELTLKQKKFC